MTLLIGFNPYALVALNGFCTGLGVVTAGWVFEKIFKCRLNKAHRFISRLPKIIKKKK